MFESAEIRNVPPSERKRARFGETTNSKEEWIMKRAWTLVLAGVVTITAGCILDNSKSDTDSSKEPSVIKDLTMGGGVVYFKSEGYALAEFGTFFNSNPYEKARVFVNGLELKNSMGTFLNEIPIPPERIANGKPVRITVYALGDSVVHEIPLPEAPVVVRPAENEVLTVGKDATFEIDYPGSHQFISMALTNQDSVAIAVETQETRLTVPVPGAKLPNEGTCQLTAVASNASGPIPKDIDLNKQYIIFTVSTVTLMQVTFAKQ
jgi:hypothetical protein